MHPDPARFKLAALVTRVVLLSSVFSGAPMLAAAIAAAAHPGSHMTLALAVWRASPAFMSWTVFRAAAASVAVASVIGLVSMFAWRPGHALIRAARLVGVFWVVALVLHPGFGAWLPLVRGWPWWLGVSIAAVVVAALHLWPGALPGASEAVLTVAATFLFFWSPRGPMPRIAELAGRELGSRDVLIIGFDSATFDDVKETLVAFTPTHGEKIIYANAWTTVASTSAAWRTVLSGAAPGPEALLPGARWRASSGWLPAELAPLGYDPAMLQDEPETNTFGGGESVRVPTSQGWKAILEGFTWKAVFPLSVVAAHPWIDALGAPAYSPGWYSYSPERFMRAAFEEIGALACRGPVFFAAHTCYGHAPIHLSLSEAQTLPRWWERSPRSLEGAGNVFTDALATGTADIAQTRARSVRGVIRMWLDELERQGILGRTPVFLLSDHGPRGAWVPQDVTDHVMLAAFLPGHYRTAVVSTPVSLVDVAPTIRRIIGLPNLLMDGEPLPLSDAEGRPGRVVKRLEAMTLQSAGVRLENETAADVSRALRFNADGSYEFTAEFAQRALEGYRAELAKRHVAGWTAAGTVDQSAHSTRN